MPGRMWTVSPAIAAEAARTTVHHGVWSDVACTRLYASEQVVLAPLTQRSAGVSAVAVADTFPTAARTVASATTTYQRHLLPAVTSPMPPAFPPPSAWNRVSLTGAQPSSRCARWQRTGRSRR